MNVASIEIPTDLDYAWFAGIFDGEGTFSFHRGVAKSIAVQMTDQDVIERIHRLFGGSICVSTPNNPKYKPTWRWSLYRGTATRLIIAMYPLLCARRQDRAREFILSSRQEDQRIAKKQQKVQDTRDQVRRLRETGLTHQKIADIIGSDRTTVSHILRGKYDT